MTNPMLQFFQTPLIPIHVWGGDLTITNGVLFMFLSTFAVICFFSVMLKPQLVPGRWQALVETTLVMLADMLGPFNTRMTRTLLPIIASLFFMIAFGNVLGLVPGAFTFTSQLVVTLSMALAIFILSIILGFWKRGLGFLRQFVPKGVSVWLWPIVIPIEVVSFFTRPLSLGLRLFVNMVAGHSIMTVLASFVAGFGFVTWCVGIANAVLFVLEVGIALLQAYVFAVLGSLYLREAVRGH